MGKGVDREIVRLWVRLPRWAYLYFCLLDGVPPWEEDFLFGIVGTWRIRGIRPGAVACRGSMGYLFSESEKQPLEPLNPNITPPSSQHSTLDTPSGQRLPLATNGLYRYRLPSPNRTSRQR